MIKKITVALLCSGIVYLLGAFSAASFDISTWDSYGRTMCAIYMLMAGGLGFIMDSIAGK